MSGDRRQPATLSTVSRYFTVHGRRTTVRLDPVMWQAVEQIAEREALTVDDIVRKVDIRRGALGLTPALRVFIIAYLRRGFFPEGAVTGVGGPEDDLLLGSALAQIDKTRDEAVTGEGQEPEHDQP